MAEGERQSAILSAEGQKQAQILAAEGRREAAYRDAEARERSAEAEAKATTVVSEAIGKGSVQAINYFVANNYVGALKALAEAKNQKVLILPLEASSVSAPLPACRRSRARHSAIAAAETRPLLLNPLQPSGRSRRGHGPAAQCPRSSGREDFPWKRSWHSAHGTG